MPRKVRVIVLAVIGVNLLWMVPIAVVFGVKWLGADEPNVARACREGTCYSGEGTNMFLTILFGGMALVTLLIGGLLAVRWARQAREREALLSTGLRAPALLVQATPTNVRINDRRLIRLVFEARLGGTPVRAEARSTTPPPLGTRATIAYDAVNPARAVLVEDVDRLALDAAGGPSGQQAVADRIFAEAGYPGQATTEDGTLLHLRALVRDGHLSEEQFQAVRARWTPGQP